MKFQKDIRIGAAAFISPNGSVHCNTFVNAVNLAAKHFRNMHKRTVRLLWENDEASYEGGKKAAGSLVRKNIDACVGHYASAAASGALPVYRQSRIPVFLPAATADNLTVDFDTAFRLCRTDSDLARYTCNMITHICQPANVLVEHDQSLHGRSLSLLIQSLLAVSGQLAHDHESPSAIVFVGSYQNSIRFLHRCREKYPDCTIFFTDDAVHTDIEKDAKEWKNNLYIAGYAPADWYPGADMLTSEYYNTMNVYPSTYFLETYAAMQIALSCCNAPGNKNKLEMIAATGWNTVLGEVRFANRENNCCRFAIWRIDKNKGLQAFQYPAAYA